MLILALTLIVGIGFSFSCGKDSGSIKTGDIQLPTHGDEHHMILPANTNHVIAINYEATGNFEEYTFKITDLTTNSVIRTEKLTKDDKEKPNAGFTQTLQIRHNYSIYFHYTDDGGWLGKEFSGECTVYVYAEDSPEISFSEEFQETDGTYTTKIIEGEQIPTVTVTDDLGLYSIKILDENDNVICSQSYPAIGTTSVEVNFNKIEESLPDCSNSKQKIEEFINNEKILKISASGHYSTGDFTTKKLKVKKLEKPSYITAGIWEKQGNGVTGYMLPYWFTSEDSLKEFEDYNYRLISIGTTNYVPFYPIISSTSVTLTTIKKVYYFYFFTAEDIIKNKILEMTY